MIASTSGSPSGWNTTRLTTLAEVLEVLLDLKGRRWLCRGQPVAFGNLQPGIDRALVGRPRLEKLDFERSSIDFLRQTVRYYAAPGERHAMSDDFVALMVLQHYGFRTRLLDWSGSAYVAAHFAVTDESLDHETSDAELWSFDEPQYEIAGREQWDKWPETKNSNGQFDAGLTAFLVDEPPDWVIAAFYSTDEFPRQFAQNGAYTVTARFERDHADALQNLFGSESVDHCRRYVIDHALKPELRRTLRESHGIWRGSLFPDTAGAVATAALVLERQFKIRSTVKRGP